MLPTIKRIFLSKEEKMDFDKIQNLKRKLHQAHGDGRKLVILNAPPASAVYHKLKD